MRNDVFLDTSGIVATIRETDASHAAALALWADLRSTSITLCTTDWVLSEVLSFCARTPLCSRGATFVEQLTASSAARILPATRRAWLAAFNLYRSRPDKEWSLVDCASILACRSRRIRRVFTADEHFAQAGLEPLLA